MSNIENNEANQQHEIIGATNVSSKAFEPNPHPDTEWFKNGGNLGLFIHYGISAVDGNVDISWSMMANKPWENDENIKFTITPEEYFSFAKDFIPSKYDPDKIIKAAKDAGFNYAVLTTKHHDGFALWPSKYGNFGTKTHQNGVDLVKPFVDACNKHGFKVGLYYSPPDWYLNQDYMSFNYGSKLKAFPDRPHFNIKHQPIEQLPPKPVGWEMQEAEYISNQIRELLTNYGKIDILWFDGNIPLYKEAITIEEIRKLQPAILVTPRLHGQGDFTTCEYHFPVQKPEGTWEYCTTWTPRAWGYSEQWMPYRSAEWAMEYYKKTTEWGGNFLLNVGPNKNGSLPENAYERFNELKALMKSDT